MSQFNVNEIFDKDGNDGAVLHGVASAPGGMNFRNRLINSDMRIDQRNAGAAVTVTGAGIFGVDRWQGQAVADTSKFSTQQSTEAAPNFTNSTKVTSLSSYSPSTNAIQVLKQNLEVATVADNGWGTPYAKPMTLSFWVRSSITGTFGGAVTRADNGTVAKTFVFTYAISSADTWEYKTVEILADTDSNYVYGSFQNHEGAQVRFDLGSSSTKQSSTVGSWQVGNFFGATSGTNLLATNGATWYITGVQLEIGSVATPFERRPYGTELSLCQRYYYLYVKGSEGDSGLYASVCTGAGILANYMQGTINFATTMRTSPSLVSSTGTNYYQLYSGSSQNFNSISGQQFTPNACTVLNSSVTISSGAAAIVYTQNANAFIALNAEL